MSKRSPYAVFWMRRIEVWVVLLLLAFVGAFGAMLWRAHIDRVRQGAMLAWHRHADGCLRELHQAVTDYQRKFGKPPGELQALFDTQCILPGGWLGASEAGTAGGFDQAANETWTLRDETLIRDGFLSGAVIDGKAIVAVILPPKELSLRTMSISLDGTAENWSETDLRARMEEWLGRTGGLAPNWVRPAVPAR